MNRALSVLPIAASATAVLLTSTAAGAQSQCRSFDKGEEVAILADRRINEASGLSASWQNPGIFWIHNDSGDSARLFAVDEAGETVTVVSLTDASARDWEDMAVGPCTTGSAEPCIYVADIGDNNSERETVSLTRFPEPELGLQPPETLAVGEYDRLEFTYADGPRDAEALLVHPVDARIFIVDKTPGDPSNMWHVEWTTDTTVATKIAETSTGEDFIFGNRVTGGDFAPDPTEFSIRTYGYVYTYCGADPVEAFAGEPSSVIPINLKQSEAVTYGRDGESIWVTTEIVENIPPPLVRLDVEHAAEPEPTGEMAASPVDADADTSPDDAGPDLARSGDAPEEPVSGSSCACTSTRQKAGSPVEVGLLALLFLVRFRRQTPSSACRRHASS